MRRRGFLATSGTVFMPSPPFAVVQRGVPHFVYLWFGAPGSEQNTTEGLRAGLRELGYQEGRDVVIDHHYAGGSEERLNQLVAEGVAARPAVILSLGGIVTAAVRQATATIPVIATTDLLGDGFVASLARPGGSITGFTITPGAEIAQKWLELVHEIIPSARRVAYLTVESDRRRAAYLTKMREAGSILDPNPTASVYTVARASDYPAAFETIALERAGTLIADANVLAVSNRTAIVGFAAKHRLPAIYTIRDFADAGGLMSHGTRIFHMWRGVASHIVRIFKGASPSDLPVQQPARFELVVNLKTAKALGLTIPQSLLARADEVIE